MFRAHKIRLVPTRTQEQALRKACGTARYAWNWALAEWTRQYNAGQKPNALALKKQWNACKPEWVYDSPKDCNQQPFDNLGKAFRAFFRKKSDRPSFKKRGVRDSFYISSDRFKCAGRWVKLSILGKLRMREILRFEGRILAGTVSCEAGQWYLSVWVEVLDMLVTSASSVVGVDVGIGRIGVASDDTECRNPKILKQLKSKLCRAQRAIARKVKCSANHHKAVVRLQRLHKRATDVRDDSIHKFTHRLAKNHGTAVIETLGVEEMKDKAPRWLRVLLQDTAMREMHRQLEYKMAVLRAPKFYASSKTCSGCGNKKTKLSLACRLYHCGECGMVMDRDLNASHNLRLMRWVTPCRPVEGPKGPVKQEVASAHQCTSGVTDQTSS